MEYVIINYLKYKKSTWYDFPYLPLKIFSSVRCFYKAKLHMVSFELHQTFTFEVIKKRKYISKPNI